MTETNTSTHRLRPRGFAQPNERGCQIIIAKTQLFDTLRVEYDSISLVLFLSPYQRCCSHYVKMRTFSFRKENCFPIALKPGSDFSHRLCKQQQQTTRK